MSALSIPCAIYTRKSSEEGLEQGFNSLDAQREACEAFILSQKQEGWKALPTLYDDGGYSGGNIERPALKQLLEDIDHKKIKVVVVYKVDRLTRSLADFAKIVEQFDAKGVSFVSVTQQFNTTSSMGRLTLNVLLSFAQFEREVTGERIRDKIAASKAKGMWMGGTPPIGYVGQDRTLVVDEESAQLVRMLYERYLELGSIRLLKAELDRQGITAPARLRSSGNVYGGKPFSRGNLHRILTSRVYLGEICHFDKSYPGQHNAIIPTELWNAVNQKIETNRQAHASRAENSRPQASSISFLDQLLFDQSGERLVPSHSSKNTTRYRYYLSASLVNGPRSHSPNGQRLPAADLEGVVLTQTLSWLSNSHQIIEALDPGPENISKVLHLASECIIKINQLLSRSEVIHALLHQVIVRHDAIELWINPHYFEINKEAIALAIPTQLKRCGYAMRLIVNNGDHQSHVDQQLIAHIAKAQNWFNQIKSGQVNSIDALAIQEKVDRSHVVRTLHKAFLAPDIVRAILKGEQPQHLTLKWLKQFRALPIDWDEQRALLGFDQTSSRTATSAN